MGKKVIKLTESDLEKIIKRVIQESEYKEKRKSTLGKYKLNEDFQSDDGLVVAGSNKYKMFTDGTERYYNGVDAKGNHKVCATSWGPCKTVGPDELDSKIMTDLENQMRSGKPVVSYTTPKNVKIEFRKT